MKSYNKTVIDFNFGRHKDLSTLKSVIHLGLAASVNNHFFGWINPHVYLIEVNNCIILIIKPVHEISNNLVLATGKASDQPAHMRSLIRAFACPFSIL